MDVKPCIDFLGCKCKVRDDFPELAEKVRKASAVVVGGYAPYGSVDGVTKAFLERLFCLRHQNGLDRGKFAVVVASGIGRGATGFEETSQQIEHALTVLPWVFGDNTEVTPDKFCKVEDQSDVWEKANELGPEIAKKIKKRALM